MLLPPLRHLSKQVSIRRVSSIAMSTDPYKVYTLSPIPGAETLPDGSKAVDAEDWVEQLDLKAVTKMHSARNKRIKVLVLYGSLRER